MDDATRKAWSFFGKKKSNLADKISELLISLNGKGLKVHHVRCDNAGENTAGLQTLCSKWGINMEFTAPHTPKQNGVVERMFVTLQDRGMAMMHVALLTNAVQGKLWAEFMSTATMLHNALVNPKTGISPDKAFTGETPRICGFLQHIGRVAHVTIREKNKLHKLAKKSKKCILLGYAENHPRGTCRFWNPTTGKVFISRDIKWGDWQGQWSAMADMPAFQQVHIKAEPPAAPAICEDTQVEEDDIHIIPVEPSEDEPEAGRIRAAGAARASSSTIPEAQGGSTDDCKTAGA